MKRTNTYCIHYIEYWSGEEKLIDVLASSKAEAYDKAVFEDIPKREDGILPYSAWVSSVTYQNGNSREFNTFSGNPY